MLITNTMTWKITPLTKIPKLHNPIFVEGLPGIGNVGKVAVDFIAEELKAVKSFELFSYSFPHSVFVNEENLVELPNITISIAKRGKEDIIFLVGDIQPLDEVSSYEFCDMILDLCEKMGVKEIITLGGIGLGTIPKKPRVFATGNDKEIVKRYKKLGSIEENLYGVVGPIIGATGLLLGLGKKRNIPAVALLAETYANPLFLGVAGGKELIKLLDKRFSLSLDMSKLDKEINDLESEMMRRTEEMSKVSRDVALKRFSRKEMNYIG